MESIEENHEHTGHEIDNNDTNVGGFEANGGQEPYIGMEFESQENAHLFYMCYAKRIGFGVSIKTSRRSKIDRQFIAVKGINQAQKHCIETLQHVGVRTSKIYATMAKQYGEKNEDAQIFSFKIMDFQRNEDFLVEWDASKEEISCMCRLFEYNGYLCRHSLMAIQAVGVFAVPSRYILRRWTKDIRSKHHKKDMNEDVCSNKKRYDLLYKKAIELLEEASLTNESCKVACNALEESLKQCSSINHSLKTDKENVCKDILHDKSLLDPQVSKTKGAPRRIKSGVEKGRKRTYDGKVKKFELVQKEAMNTFDVHNVEVVTAATRMV
ncbi:Zinc finger, PMZ-type [Sesbania bispinosa]|nr:Zinc finger, PMZ-type [Sesbania bispinosa]